MDEQISVFEPHNNYLEKFMGIRRENSIKQRNETNIYFYYQQDYLVLCLTFYLHSSLLQTPASPVGLSIARKRTTYL